MQRLFKRNDTEGETSPVGGFLRRLSNRSTSSQRSPLLQHSPLQHSPLQQSPLQHNTPVLQQQDSKKREIDAPLSAKPKFSPTNHSTKRSGITAADGTQRSVATKHGSGSMSMVDALECTHIPMNGTMPGMHGFGPLSFAAANAAAAANQGQLKDDGSRRFAQDDELYDARITDEDLAAVDLPGLTGSTHGNISQDDTALLKSDTQETELNSSTDEAPPSPKVVLSKRRFYSLVANFPKHCNNSRREMAQRFNDEFEELDVPVQDWESQFTVDPAPEPVYTVPLSGAEVKIAAPYRPLEEKLAQVCHQIDVVHDAEVRYGEDSNEYDAARDVLRGYSTELEEICDRLQVEGGWTLTAGKKKGHIFVPDRWGQYASHFVPFIQHENKACHTGIYLTSKKPNPVEMVEILARSKPPPGASDTFKALHRQANVAGGTKWYEVKNGNPALKGRKIPKNVTMVVSDHGDYIWGEKSKVQSRKDMLELRTLVSTRGGEPFKKHPKGKVPSDPYWRVKWKPAFKWFCKNEEQSKVHLLVLHTMALRQVSGDRTADHLLRNHNDNRYCALAWATKREQGENRD